jgi:CMP-N-acetylneuraminic acid synthetase
MRTARKSESQKPKAVAIIPARGGSKGIPRKNVRMMAGHPLIAHIIRAARQCEKFDHVFVTTEDAEIAEISRRYGAEIIKRPKALAGDEVTLDPVVMHAVGQIEARGVDIDIVGVLQPTSPTLRPETIARAFDHFIEEGSDSLITVVNATHLYWRQEGNAFVPLFPERLNRQFLPTLLKETGSFTLSRRQVVTETGRFGRKVSFFELSEDEAVDIDTPMHWWTAEKLLSRKRVVFRVDGHRGIGLGHVYRTLTLALKMIDHEVLFLMNARYPLGISVVRQHNFPVVTFRGDVLESLRKLRPHMVINDILDTQVSYIRELKQMGAFVVNFEDLGPGARHAHLTINALYGRRSQKRGRYLTGPQYVCLRDEFHSVFPRPVVEKAKRVLITFGGIDENNLTLKALRAVDGIPGLKTTIILGLGYREPRRIREAARASHNTVRVLRNVRCMSKYMREADIIITSCGRTLFEAASVGCPTVALAQNQRELLHPFAREREGIVFLGEGSRVKVSQLRSEIKRLAEDHSRRKRMQEALLKLDLRRGIDRVVKAIMESFTRWQDHEQ